MEHLGRKIRRALNHDGAHIKNALESKNNGEAGVSSSHESLSAEENVSEGGVNRDLAMTSDPPRKLAFRVSSNPSRRRVSQTSETLSDDDGTKLTIRGTGILANSELHEGNIEETTQLVAGVGNTGSYMEPVLSTPPVMNRNVKADIKQAQNDLESDEGSTLLSLCIWCSEGRQGSFPFVPA